MILRISLQIYFRYIIFITATSQSCSTIFLYKKSQTRI